MTKPWKPPLRCRWLGHRLEQTHFVFRLFGFLETPLLRCTKCGMGKRMGLGGFDTFSPAMIEDFFAKVAGVQAGKVIELKRVKP